MEEYRRQAHCTYHTRYHLVFVTKYRRNVLRGSLGEYAKAVLLNVTRTYPD
ncbi:transposase, partial [Patescibacteria group bacterium]|nr:transposase [Patescibacteria group bacterium]